MDKDTELQEATCPYCNNTKCLTQKGILHIYLLALKLPLALILIGLLGAAFYSNYMLILAIIGLVYPITMADLRMYLYPVAVLAHSLGKKLNCPKCEPHGSMFRS